MNVLGRKSLSRLPMGAGISRQSRTGELCSYAKLAVNDLPTEVQRVVQCGVGDGYHACVCCGLGLFPILLWFW